MTPKPPSFRLAMNGVHTTLCLITGWVLFAIALTGTLSVFRQDINTWARPELLHTTTPPLIAQQKALDWLKRTAPDASTWYVGSGNESALRAFWITKSGQFKDVTLNPQTGTPDHIRDTIGGDFFYRFHFELMLPFPFGRLIAAIAALALVTALLTGLVIHRRLFADFFTLRLKKGQRSWLDLHNLLGVAPIPFHLMISFTGAVTLGTLLLPWSTQAAYHHDIAAANNDLYQTSPVRPPAGQPGTLAPFLPILEAADHQFHHAGIWFITVHNPADRNATLTMVSDNTGIVSARSLITVFDGSTGQILKTHIENRPILSLYAFLYGLHVAHFTPPLTKWLYFLSGLALTAVIGSGMTLWVTKRSQKNPRRIHHMTARLNCGIMGGACLAFTGFFIANRLLPTSLPHRADHETHCILALWSLSILYSLLRRPSRAWPHILATTALLCLLITPLSRPLDTSITQTLSATAGLFALLFGYAAFHMARKNHSHPC